MYPESDLVFHYTPHTIVILESGLIRFGNMYNTNDLYERKLWGISPTVWGGADKEAADSLERAYLTGRLIHERSRTFCTVKDSSANNHLGRGYMNFPLWWNYAKQNKGACFVFDKLKLQETVLKRAQSTGAVYVKVADISYDLASCDLIPVYNPTIPLTSDEAIMFEHMLNHLKRFDKTILFTKDSSWCSENELRFAVICHDHIPFDINLSDFLVGIILGYDFAESEISLVKKYLAKISIKNIAVIDFYDGKPILYDLPNHGVLW